MEMSMRRITLGTVFLVLTVIAAASVRVDIYEADGVTPFDDRNIPVGTELKLLVWSDSKDLWSGGLFLQAEHRNQGLLLGSGWDPNTRDWQGCHFIGAGSEAYVYDWEDSQIQGFDLFTSPEGDASLGAWFMIDYVALEPGEPNIAIYEYDASWDDPNAFVYLHQVPSADLNTDGIVNLLDFSFLSYHWLEDDCGNLNDCEGADLDHNGEVDLNDLLLLTDYWLWPTPRPSEGPPQQQEPDKDPNLIYQIVDANGLSEITLTVGESITLYANMETIYANEVWSFSIEATVSDPNLGSIDNTAYDPNNPPGPGTARILAQPNRWTAFDRWGPGYQQPVGIYLSGLSSGGAFEDGCLASFVYTSQAAGDVVLTLINWDTTSTTGEKLYPTLESIIIHQQELLSSETMMMSTMSMDTSSFEVSTPAMSPEEIVQTLEDIWESDPDIQTVIDPKDWNEFMKSVKRSY
jgi:hypothetical protein